jgi:DNA polymerase elongation subunit (family B)
MLLQPADWLEVQASDKKYAVDVFGRLADDRVARLRITGFQPYFYIRAKDGETRDFIYSKISSEMTKEGKYLAGLKISQELKLDAMVGFSQLKPIRVWKLTFNSGIMMKTVSRVMCDILDSNDVFESGLPPLIRLFHETDISPASPISFEAEEEEPGEDENVDVCFTCSYEEVNAEPSAKIGLYAAAYDIETYSSTGNFPQASIAEDEIIQIGVSFRYTDDLLNSFKRIVFVSGTCSPSEDESVTFISCKSEKHLLQEFQKCIRFENPDILAGYNTFGFDDAYIADRCEYNKIGFNIGRVDISSWKTDRAFAPTEKKTFELASGKFAVRYLEVAGRLAIDLLLSVRREQSLDSYKLDNVSSTFLRDKVTQIEYTESTTKIYTKSTRGLFVGNLVTFDVVTNTQNPYHESEKFQVIEKADKWFVVNSVILKDLNKEDISKLEWCFGKDDISAQDMFASHRGKAEDRAMIAKYCIQDCDLVLTLMAKLDTFVNARGMADVCRVPIQYIFLRGQGIKIFSAVVYNASKRNQVLANQKRIGGSMSYEGAIVLPPKIGMYLDQPISVLDFNSLYPSNMIAFNLSPDTLVYVKTFNATGKKIKHEGPDGVEIKAAGFVIDEISYDTFDDDKKPSGRMTCGFVQPNADPRTVGVLPLTLDILLKKRKETRKLLETTEDDSQKAVLNGLQLAYKLVANSVYGQCGSATSAIRKLEVAACTTALGRARIYDAKKVVESEFGATVIYGDSVASYTPVMIRSNGNVNIVNISELADEWTEYGDKESCEIQGVESWTENGWTPIQRIIRHKLAPHKKMIRVLTHTGCVDVTDDHSLLRKDNTEVSPSVLKVGDELLHYQFPETHRNSNISVDEARIMGFFMGDGSCGIYHCPSGQKSSWALNNANPDLLNYYVEICSKVYPNLEWVINPTLVSSGVFKLVPKSNQYGGIKQFVDMYRDLMYVDKRKIVPIEILNGSLEVCRSFWDGLYDADGDKDIRGNVRIDQKNETTAAQIVYLGFRLGYKIGINTRVDKPHVYRITCVQNYRKNPDAIKKIHEIEYKGYVYDLTTSNHHFQAGIGQMIVHNTDSVFVQFPTKDLRDSIESGKRAAEKITSLCRKPYKIEYEKTFYPFILFCRKRYVGLMYEDDVSKCKRKTMGIALKRRDNAPIVKDVFGGALDILLEHRNIRQSFDFVKEMLVKVVKNEIPLEKYIITKQLRDDYKNPGQIAHRVLADRMEERDAGNKPQVGDRLSFIYVEKLKDAKKQGDRIEHLDYVREKKLKPDTEFYISNQIQNPVAQMFALAIEDLEGYKPVTDYKKAYDEYRETLDEEEATLKVLALKEKQLEKMLFLGASYLNKHKRGPMDMFIKRA